MKFCFWFSCFGLFNFFSKQQGCIEVRNTKTTSPLVTHHNFRIKKTNKQNKINTIHRPNQKKTANKQQKNKTALSPPPKKKHKPPPSPTCKSSLELRAGSFSCVTLLPWERRRFLVREVEHGARAKSEGIPTTRRPSRRTFSASTQKLQ